MPRKKKVLDSVEASIPTKEKWECTRCEHSYETPTGHFYKNSFSQLFKNRGGFSTLCKECVNELFDEYTKRYESERIACMILCHMLDFPFYNSLYDSIVQNSGSCKPGMYARVLSCRQYQFQTFATVLTNGELNKNALDVRDEKEQKWSKAEIQARDDVVSVVGYDPFEGHSENDRRYLFSDLIKYFEDGIEDDPYKLSQIIQVVINNGQIRKIDFRLAQLDPMNSADTIKSLNDIKVKLVSNNDKIAKENEISVKNRSNKDAGRNTLTFLMKDMREKDIAGAEANFYDQLRSPGTQWAADMSVKAIKENAFFDENDMQEIFDTQRELIDKFQKESDDAKEKYRLSLIENQRLKELLEDAGIDASAKDTDGDAV